MLTLKELIKNNTVRFDSYRSGFFYYDLVTTKITNDNTDHNIIDKIYQFTIPVDDIGNGTLLALDKAITYMRWIRKAIENNTLIELK